eukprot:Pgem_evm2s4021
MQKGRLHTDLLERDFHINNLSKQESILPTANRVFSATHAIVEGAIRRILNSPTSHAACSITRRRITLEEEEEEEEEEDEDEDEEEEEEEKKKRKN